MLNAEQKKYTSNVLILKIFKVKKITKNKQRLTAI